VVSRQGRNLGLAIVGGLVFGTAAWGASFAGAPLTYLFIQENSQVYGGYYWQLLTSLVVAPPFPFPLGVIDVLFNAIAVVWLDGLLSGTFKARTYYAIFILAGLSGNLLSLASGPGEASFGASGGIFGLLAAAVSEDYAGEGRINYVLLLWFIAIFTMSSFTIPYVNWVAHLGGAVFGLAAGYYLGIGRRNEQL
jgi:rhomboid protease GluP